MMRYNVVIGGQEISNRQRVDRLSSADFGQGRLVGGGKSVTIPLILLLVMVRLFPPWKRRPPSSGRLEQAGPIGTLIKMRTA